MRIQRLNPEQYTLHSKANFKDAKERLAGVNHSFLCITDDNQRLKGIVTNGDFKRARQKNDNLDAVTIGDICNVKPKWLSAELSDEQISKHFDSLVREIPLLSCDGRLHSVAKILDIKDKLNLNIGAGARVFNGFINLDVKSDWYEHHHQEASSAQFVEYDILKDRLPYNINEVDNIYLSHVVEHLENNHVEKLLADCHRVLLPGGVMRIACPDADFLAEISSFENDFWFWRRDWFRVHASHLSLGDISQFDYLVREIATSRVGVIRKSDFSEDCLSPQNRYQTLERIVSGLSFDKDNIGNHINFWTFEKLKKCAQKSGFKYVIRSKYQGCVSQDMKGRDFDTTRPEMSLYVDLVK